MAKRSLSLFLAALMLLSMLPMAYAEGEPEQPAEAEPTVTEETVEPEEPAGTEEPIEPEEPAEPEEPIVAEEPAEPKEPVEAEEPIVAEEPAATEEPIITEEPVVTEEPAAPEAPAEPETAPETEAPAAPVEEPIPEPEEPAEEPAEEELTAQEEAQTKTEEPTSGDCGEPGKPDKVRWIVTPEGSRYKLTITGVGRMGDLELNEDGEYVPPWHVYPIQTIYVDPMVTYIGAHYFNHSLDYVTTIDLPSSVTEIGDYAFASSAPLLTELKLPYNLQTIGAHAFEGMGLEVKSFTIPDSVTKIGESAFARNTLGTVHLPSGITSLPDSVFASSGITSIEIPSTVTSIGKNALEQNAFSSVSIPAGVVSIGDYAFSYCQKLKSVTVPDSVKTMGTNVFNECTALTSARLPSGMTVIPGHTFEGCSKLASYTIPSSIKEIGAYAFAHTALTSVTLSEGLTTIGDSAFYATKLTSVTIPASVELIKYGAFNITSTLTSLTFAGGYTQISPNAAANTLGNPATTTIYYYTESPEEDFLKNTSFNLVSLGVAKPGQPKLLKVQNIGGGSVKLTWEPSIGAVSYIVYSKSSGGSWKQMTKLSDCEFLYQATAGQTLTFTVKAQDSRGHNSTYDSKGLTITVSNTADTTSLSTPKISKLTNTSTGIKITWGKVTGAAKYRVYYKKSGKWTKLKDSTGTSYTWTGAKVGTKYTFTVKAFDKNGKESAYDKTGKSITYYKLKTPAVPKLSNTTTGIKISWTAVSGAAKYRLFYKTSSGKWTKIGDTAKTSYTWKKAQSGTKYSFTVRCVTSDGKGYTSDYNTTGKSITYIAAPKVSKVANTTTGIKITWSKVTGAAKYRLFYKTGSGSWKKIGDTTKTSYTWTKAKSGTKYSFTVRCVDKNGEKYTSAYDSIGKSITYIAAPKVSKVAKATGGIKITWGKVAGAAKYRVFYKVGNGKWTKAGDTTKTSYTWTKAKSGTTYSFTVRCVNKTGKSYTSAYDTKGLSITYKK